LLLRIRDPRDADAWETFISLYGGVIVEYCRRRHLQIADANEIDQEVLLQVSRSIGRFDYAPERGKFRSWLIVIVRSKLTEFLRTHRKSPPPAIHEVQVEELEHEVDGEWTDVWQAQLVATAMRHVESKMSPKHFAAFRAAWVDGFSAEEVSKQIEKSVSWVYVAKCRGLSLLRSAIQELSDESPLFYGSSERVLDAQY
jgi:RNA polymerase sigma-70 factor, ECF subfamily